MLKAVRGLMALAVGWYRSFYVQCTRDRKFPRFIFGRCLRDEQRCKQKCGLGL